MAKACCKKKGTSSTPGCVVQPGTNFTFLVTVGQGTDFNENLIYGFSDGTSLTSTFGNIVGVDYSQVPSEYGGVANFFNSSSLPILFKSVAPQNALPFEIITSLYIDGIQQPTNQILFSASDVGKTYCISLSAIQGG